jgi:hypothetical protein
MKPSPKLLLALALTLAVCGRVQSQGVSCGQLEVGEVGVSKQAYAASTIREAAATSALDDHLGITRYVTEYDGDHSLEAAIVAEQVFARYSLYTVRLQFASGAEQSIAITAPPGGLRPEMRDMSGDSVPNDLVLTSRLLRSPLIVLLNDGHDHLTVAVSPDSFASGEGRALGAHQTHYASALMSSSFKAGGLTNGGALFHSRPQENLLSPITQRVTESPKNSSSSGRAPPLLLTQI